MLLLCHSKLGETAPWVTWKVASTSCNVICVWCQNVAVAEIFWMALIITSNYHWSKILLTSSDNHNLWTDSGSKDRTPNIKHSQSEKNPSLVCLLTISLSIVLYLFCLLPYLSPWHSRGVPLPQGWVTRLASPHITSHTHIWLLPNCYRQMLLEVVLD